MNPSPYLLVFLLSWTVFVVFLWASVFSKKLRVLTAIFFLSTLLALIFSIRKGFSKAFPLQIKKYSLEKEGVITIGNGSDADLVIYNPKSDREHLRIVFRSGEFKAINLSGKRRVEMDGEDLDTVLLGSGESIEVGGGRLAVGRIMALPFSARVRVNLQGTRTLRFLLKSEVKLRMGDYTWGLSYLPPSLLGINLLFWELFLSLLLSFLGFFLLLRGFYLSASGIFLSLAGSFFPFLLPFALILLIAGGVREKRAEVLLPALLFLLPMVFPGRLAVRVRHQGGVHHFEKAFSYGRHRVVLGRTLYLMNVSPGRLEMRPSGVEGFSGAFEKFVYSPLKLKSHRFLYLPFPRNFPPTHYTGHRVVLKGERGELVISRAEVNILKFSLPFIFIFSLYLLSVFSGARFIPATVFYFLLSLGGIFVRAAGLFDPAFSFISRSYMRLGILPAGLLFFVLSPGLLSGVLSFLKFLVQGFSIRETWGLLRLEKGRRFSLFEFLNRPIAGQVLWVDFLFLLSLVLIAVQFLMGGEAGIKGGGLSLQFFEAGKILLAVYLADWLFRSQENRFQYPFLIPYILIFIPFFLLIFTLGDFSPLAVFLPAILAHFLLISRPIKVKLPSGIIATVLFLSGVVFSLRFFFPPDVALRLQAWLKPALFSRPAEQFLRAFWLFKTGGLAGNFPWGFVNSHSVPLLLFDFPLALFVANFGLAGALLFVFTLLALLPFLFLRSGGLYEERWNFYVLSFSMLVFLSQVALPFLILTGILPVMGQPLPFLSKANSDLLLFVLPFFLLANYLKKEERFA